MAPQSFRGMVMFEQFPFRKNRMDLRMANNVQGDGFFSLEGFGKQVMLIDRPPLY